MSVLTLAALAGGCGDPSSPPEAQARGSLDTFLATCAEKRPRLALPTLQPAAQSLVLEGTPAEGCGKVLGVERPERLTADDFRRPAIRLVGFDGATSRFAVGVASIMRTVTLTFGDGGWRLEGPGD